MSDRQRHWNDPATLAWAAVFGGVLLWSADEPRDRLTWLLEVAPALLGALVLVLSYRRFPLTPLVYGLILVHCVILMIGGHFTYAEVPAFHALSEWLGWQRNNYDKLGHLAQGLVPAMIARELLIRLAVVERPRLTAVAAVPLA